MTQGLTPSEKRAVIEDLRGDLPLDDADEIDGASGTQDMIDVEHLQERAKGDEAFVEELQEKLRPLYVLAGIHAAFLVFILYSVRFRRDQRTWRDRLTNFHHNWKPLIGGMVDAYLRWKYPDIALADPGRVQDPPPQPQSSTLVEIPALDIYTLSTSITIQCIEDRTTASVLAGLGFIGNAPFYPSIAISMKTLEFYRILRRRKPSFSVEAFVKVVCDLYMVCTP